MINSERNLTLMQKGIEPPGAALPDWQIIARVACEMGFADGVYLRKSPKKFSRKSPARRIRKPATTCAARAIARLTDTPLQWPLAAGQRGRPQSHSLHQRRRQPDAERNARRQPPAVRVSDRKRQSRVLRPCLCRSGRIARSGISDRVEYGPLAASMAHHDQDRQGRDAEQAEPGPVRGDSSRRCRRRLASRPKIAVEIRSRRGRAVLPAVVTERVQAGNCFAPMHWNDVFGDDLCINAVTNDAIDPVSQQPELKFCAVALSPVALESIEPVSNAGDETLIDHPPLASTRRRQALYRRTPRNWTCPVSTH